jgi:hypothetical protein
MEWKVVRLEDGGVWEDGDGRDGDGRDGEGRRRRRLKRQEELLVLWGARNMYDVRRRKVHEDKQKGRKDGRAKCVRA